MMSKSKKKDDVLKSKKTGDLLNLKIPVSTSNSALDFINKKLRTKVEGGKQSELNALVFDFIEGEAKSKEKLILYTDNLTLEQRQRFEKSKDVITNVVLSLISNEVPIGLGMSVGSPTASPEVPKKADYTEESIEEKNPLKNQNKKTLVNNKAAMMGKKFANFGKKST